MCCEAAQGSQTPTNSNNSVYLYEFNLLPHAQTSLVWSCTSFCWSLWPRKGWNAQPFAGTLFILRSAASASGRLTKATYHSFFREPWGWGTGQAQNQLPGNGNAQISREKSLYFFCMWGTCGSMCRISEGMDVRDHTAIFYGMESAAELF